MSLWLTVEVSPGSDIKKTCEEAVNLANKLNMAIWFNFNGAKCLARVNDKPDRVFKEWNRSMEIMSMKHRDGHD